MSAIKLINSLTFMVLALFGFTAAQNAGSKDLFLCKQSCYEKFVQDWHHCMDFEDCKSMCITPPNINSYIPEAFSFLCWNNCDQQLGPFPLNINSAMRQGSLVITDIGWDQAIANASKQCLVTWEVSGGGLMGNLLTDSSTVELSLWSDTIYHVQVTCKHKETGGMRRSFKLIVDTHKLGDSTATGMQTFTLEQQGFGNKNLPHIYGGDSLPTSVSNPAETDSRLRILKDSSKDFLTPYNPNAGSSGKKIQTPVRKLIKNVQKSTQINAAEDGNLQENEIVPAAAVAAATSTESENVIRRKLVAPTEHLTAKLHGQTNFLNQSVIFAMAGSLILFMGIAFLFVFLRPAAFSRKHMAAPMSTLPIDKQVLIQAEFLPSPTAAQQSRQSQRRSSLPSCSINSASSASTAAAAFANVEAANNSSMLTSASSVAQQQQHTVTISTDHKGSALHV